MAHVSQNAFERARVLCTRTVTTTVPSALRCNLRGGHGACQPEAQAQI